MRTYVLSVPSRRSLSDLRSVFRLKARGLTDREISSRTCVPINTIRTWRNGRVPGYARPRILTATHARDDTPPDVSSLPAPAYAYLLGMYLGDGCLARNGTSWTLRVALDDSYPGIIRECEEAIREVSSGKHVYTRPASGGQRCVVVACTWHPWVVLFPQHGPGRKHQRRIVLNDWQERIVKAEPRPFLRALIHTDGWRGLNRVFVKGKHYEYPRYQFSNRSDDIRRLFTDACDSLEVEWRQWTRYHVSVARRNSVALLDEFIGTKH
jgi:hypothetical protein